MPVRQPIVFRNRSGLKLFGILHMPDGGTPGDLAIILLSPGIKMRVGPERLYCVLSERLVSLGFPVLRFDFYGLGDSEGELSEELMKDVYNHIEVGRFTDDTVDAMNWMTREHGARRFILSGLCGGAITGLLTAKNDSRVAGLLALAITPLLASRSADPSLYITSGQAAELRRTYLSKLTNPRAWLRLLTLRTDFSLLWRSLQRGGRQHLAQQVPAAMASPDNASPLFPPAFFAMTESQRPILLVFGSADRLFWEYEEKFAARYKDRLASLPLYYQVHTIPQANHVLSFEPWQQEMLDVAQAWLERWFGKEITQQQSFLS